MKPIIARSNLYFHPWGWGDETKFIRNFSETWRKLPLWARRRMLRHWRTDEMKMIGCTIHPKADLREGMTVSLDLFVSPKIELLPGWVGGREDAIADPDEHAGEYAAVFLVGHIMRFWHVRFDVMPDDAAQSVIAHELAHVLQHANGFDNHFGCDDPPQGLVEEDADEIMDAWGFDPFAADEWAASVGIAKLIRTESLEEVMHHLYGPGSRYGEGYA